MHQGMPLRDSVSSSQVPAGSSALPLPTTHVAVEQQVTAGASRSDLTEQILSAKLLINYAAESGIHVETEVRRIVLAAMDESSSTWTSGSAEQFLAALTKLSKSLHPVSGDSLRMCEVEKEATKTLRWFRIWASLLAIVIVPSSAAAFIATSMCEAIRKDIDIANALAVTLVHAISPPLVPTEANQSQPFERLQLEQLQGLAATTRDIDRRARSLSLFATGEHNPPFEWIELQVPVIDFPKQTVEAIENYQLVRYFAQHVQEDVSVLFGALTTNFLPGLYALLGACAYLIRMFEKDVKARSFTGRERTAARFIVAGIGGLVVGLFGNLGTGSGAALPPLALAFLVGYGVDFFFYFLDGLLQTFGRTKPSPSPVDARRTTPLEES